MEGLYPRVQKLHEPLWPGPQNSQPPRLMPVAKRSGSIRESLYGIRRAPVATMTSSPYALRNTGEHYPLTNDQLNEVQRDVLEMNARADELAQLLAAAFGEADQRTIRAKENRCGTPKTPNGQCSGATRREPLNRKFRYRLVLPGNYGGCHGQHQ